MKISLLFVVLWLSFAAQAARIEVDVAGMTCGMCVEAITKELKDTGKAENISVSVGKASFSEIKDKRMSDGEVRAAIKKAGYEPVKVRRR